MQYSGHAMTLMHSVVFSMCSYIHLSNTCTCIHAQRLKHITTLLKERIGQGDYSQGFSRLLDQQADGRHMTLGHGSTQPKKQAAMLSPVHQERMPKSK